MPFNGVIVFDDGGELLPDGRAIAPDRAAPAVLWKNEPAFAVELATAE